jgi:long-chain acyl-CoA synthetase
MAMEASWALAALMSEMRERGDAPALAELRDGKVTILSHGEVAARALKLGAGLRVDGVAPGEAVALLAPNGPDWVIARLGIAAAGGIAVAIDDLATDDEIAEILRDSAARRVLASAPHAAALAQTAPGVTVHVMTDAGGVGGWLALFAEEEAPALPLPGEAEAMVVYTSGTTGAPKPFALTYANIAANVDALAATGVVRAGDRVLLPLPLHHVYPLVVGVLTPLAVGACVVFPAAVTGAEIAAALRAARVTIVVGVPRLYAALVDGIESRAASRGRLAASLFRALLALSLGAARRWNLRLGRLLFGAVHRQLGPDLRVMVSGGAKLEPTLLRKLQGLGWQVLSGYGLAETASIFTGNLPGRQRIGSEGQALGGGRMRIADPDADGTGEIQLKGPSVFAGYRRPADNTDVFTADGWFRTGDLGHLDADGYVYVTGRAKEVIVLGGGKNVFPETLEKQYGASPFIREIAVLEHRGALVALVLPDFAALQADGKTRPEQAIRVALASAAQALPSYQRLAGFALLREALPRTRLGKYQRFRLPALYAAARASPERRGSAELAALSAADRALLARAPASDVLRLLERRYQDAGVTLDSSPQLDLGIDSLEWMGLAAELESRFGIRIDDDALAEITTVRGLLTAAVDAAAATSAQPTATTDLRWIAPPGIFSRALGVTVYWLNRLLMRALFGLRTRGRENIPPGGPVIIVANHVSDLDPLVLAAVLPWRQMRRTWWGGDAKRLFGSRLMRRLAHAAQIFPVDELAPARALDLGAAVLARGQALVWFPESWRSPDGSLQEFLPGIGMLVARSGATVVPAYVDGAFAAMPRDRRLPRAVPIAIRFGAPVAAATLGAPDAPPQEIAARLRTEVAKLTDDGAA